MSLKSGKKISKKPSVVAVRISPLDHVLLVIILFLLALIPLITSVVMVNVISPSLSNSILDTGSRGNVFSYVRMIWLIAGTIMVTTLFLIKLIRNKYQVAASYINIPLAVMCLFIVTSSIVSKFHTISLLGYFGRNDGALTFLCYLMLFYVAANLPYPQNYRKWLMYALTPMILINVLLGLLYFYGYNILSSDLVLSFLLPSNLPKSGLQAGSYISSTLMNPDFASGMSGVLSLMFLTRAILSDNLKKRLFNGFLAAGAFTIILSSFAKSGFFTFVVMLPIIGIIIWFSKERKQKLITLSASLVVFALILITLSLHNPLVWNKSVGFFVSSNSETESLSNVNANNSASTPSSPAAVQQDSEFNLPSLGWAPGTGRVYIWQKALELIKSKPIFGYGSDTFPYVFNQDDPGKASGLADPNVIVDKPHNMFLGIAYSSGIPCLLAFLTLCFFHAKDNLRSFKARMNLESSNILIILFVGWCAFLIQALFNDPVIGTGNVFWTLFGASVSIAREERLLSK